MNTPTNIFHERVIARVTPLTPTHVWSGKESVIRLDTFALPGGKICVIDYESLDPSIIKKIVSKGTPDLSVVESMLKDPRQQARICRRIVESSVNLQGDIKRIMLSNPEIIPASSLKGYIRTAIMFNKLMALPDDKFKKYVNSGINLYTEPKNAAIGLEGLVFRAPRSGRAGGFIDIMQEVLISPPRRSEDTKLRIVEFGVYEKIGRNLTKIASSVVEALVSGTLTFDISITSVPRAIAPRHYDRIVERLSEIYGISITDSLKMFGCKVLEDELDRVRDVDELSHYASLLIAWKRKYCDNGSNCTIGRIGYMTGHQAKTVLLLIKERWPDKYKEILSYMREKTGKVWDSLTLKLTKSPKGLIGTGWCEICLSK